MKTATRNTGAAEVVTLGYYLKVINKFKWRIALLAILVTTLAMVWALQLTPSYRASATLLIEAQQRKAVSFEEVYGLDASKKEYYQTQYEILRSRAIARDVIEQLNLLEHRDFQPKPSMLSWVINDIKQWVKQYIPQKPQTLPSTADAQQAYEKRMQKIITAFSRRLSIHPIRKTQLVVIAYESSDPALAADVANAVGEAYITHAMQAKMGIAKQASGWLNDRLSILRERLDKSEQKLQSYREREDLVDIEGVVGLVRRELEQTAQQLVEAKRNQSELNAIMRVVDEYGRDDIARLESINEITTHKVIQDVKREVVTAQRKVSELRQVYGPKHPKMIAARAELATVQENLSAQIRSLVMGIEKEMRTANSTVSALQQDVEQLRQRFQMLTRKETEYHQLKREVETNRNIYDTFLSRSKETEVTSDFNSPIARFTDYAYQPTNPAKPNRKLIVVLAFVATLGFGIVLAFLTDALNDTLNNTEEVENKLGQRLLGVLPSLPSSKRKPLPTHTFFDKGKLAFAEAVRTFRTSLVLSQMDRDNQVIEVTSSVPGEGKSTTSINLAFSLGQMEKVLLIDADMRRPSLAGRFSLPAYQPGLANVLANTQQLEECIHVDEQSNIHVLCAGQIPSNPLELLSSENFKALLAHLRQQYDYIVLDTAPLEAVSDALVVSQHSDSVIYVVKSGSTRQGLVKAGLHRLIDAKANVCGVLLNQVNGKQKQGHNAHYGYYDSHGYTQANAPT